MANILLFEPDRALRSQLEWILRSRQHEIRAVEGVEELGDTRAGLDLAVVDVTDHARRGEQLVGQLRAASQVRRLPLIALIAVQVRCREADAEIWMPFDGPELIQAVGKVLARTRPIPRR